MHLPLSELRIGDRVLGRDGEYWTVTSTTDTHLRVTRPGRDPVEAPRSGETHAEVTNRSDALLFEQAKHNITEGGLV